MIVLKVINTIINLIVFLSMLYGNAHKEEKNSADMIVNTMVIVMVILDMVFTWIW